MIERCAVLRQQLGDERPQTPLRSLIGKAARDHVDGAGVLSTLRDLVIGSGLEFEDRGAHELKGVPGEWHLFAVAST